MFSFGGLYNGLASWVTPTNWFASHKPTIELKEGEEWVTFYQEGETPTDNKTKYVSNKSFEILSNSFEQVNNEVEEGDLSFVQQLTPPFQTPSSQQVNTSPFVSPIVLEEKIVDNHSPNISNEEANVTLVELQFTPEEKRHDSPTTAEIVHVENRDNKSVPEEKAEARKSDKSRAKIITVIVLAVLGGAALIALGLIFRAEIGAGFSTAGQWIGHRFQELGHYMHANPKVAFAAITGTVIASFGVLLVYGTGCCSDSKQTNYT